MSEFDPPRSRREQRRVRNVQLTLEGLGAAAVRRYEQPADGLGYTDEPTMVVFPLDGHPFEFGDDPDPPEAA